MINDVQIRIGAKTNGKATLHQSGLIENGFEWQVVELVTRPQYPSGEPQSIFGSGDTSELGEAINQAREVYVRVIRQRFPEPPVRHEFDCKCGAQLVIEARRSRRADGWDTPSLVECSCGCTFGVQLNFAGGKASLQAIPRQA